MIINAINSSRYEIQKKWFEIRVYYVISSFINFRWSLACNYSSYKRGILEKDIKSAMLTEEEKQMRTLLINSSELVWFSDKKTRNTYSNLKSAGIQGSLKQSKIDRTVKSRSRAAIREISRTPACGVGGPDKNQASVNGDGEKGN